MTTHPHPRIAFAGNYLPRVCGIATFTTDLCAALADQATECLAVAMNDRAERYDYPLPVRFTVEQNDLAGYSRAAQYRNNRVDLVSLQHEYGIFGGPAGSHVLTLLAELRPASSPRCIPCCTAVGRAAQGAGHVAPLRPRGRDESAGPSFCDVYTVAAEKIDFIRTAFFAFVDRAFTRTVRRPGKTVLAAFGRAVAGRGWRRHSGCRPSSLTPG